MKRPQRSAGVAVGAGSVNGYQLGAEHEGGSAAGAAVGGGVPGAASKVLRTVQVSTVPSPRVAVMVSLSSSGS